MIHHGLCIGIVLRRGVIEMDGPPELAEGNFRWTGPTFTLLIEFCISQQIRPVFVSRFD